jgi:hypothetical protein
VIRFFSTPCSTAKNITLFTTNGNWLISAEATLFGVSKNGTEIKLYGNIPGSGYALLKLSLKQLERDWHL